MYERSGGNALFLTELAVLSREQPDSTELPGSLRALIAARLDRLDPGPRAVLDNAAVLGATGPLSSLHEFANGLGQNYDPAYLDRLVDDGLLEIDDMRWHFRSDVVREVAYGMLTKAVRAQRHAGVAAVSSGHPMVPVERVAHHVATAAELVSEIGSVEGVTPAIKANAVQLLLQAVRRSLDVGAFSQAARHATRALDLGPDSDELTRELLLLRVESAVGRRERQRSSWRRRRRARGGRRCRRRASRRQGAAISRSDRTDVGQSDRSAGAS